MICLSCCILVMTHHDTATHHDTILSCIHQPPLGLSKALGRRCRRGCLWHPGLGLLFVRGRMFTLQTCQPMCPLGLPLCTMNCVKPRPYADLRAALQDKHCWHCYLGGERCHKRQCKAVSNIIWQSIMHGGGASRLPGRQSLHPGSATQGTAVTR